MILLSYGYRFAVNFIFLALVYFSLNFMDKYDQRTIVALLVLVYVVMRAASALRSFHFYSMIERLEIEARRLAGMVDENSSAAVARKQIGRDVGKLRHAGEFKSYIDLFFLSLILALCVSKIVMG